MNDVREEKGLDRLAVEVVDHVYADDAEIISSTCVLVGEIDEHGKIKPGCEGRPASCE